MYFETRENEDLSYQVLTAIYLELMDLGTLKVGLLPNCESHCSYGLIAEMNRYEPPISKREAVVSTL